MNIGPTLLLISVLKICGRCMTEPVRYDGHKVLQISPKETKNIQTIIDLESRFNLDFWQIPRHLNDSFHIRVHPEKLVDFMSVLQHIGTDIDVMIDDVQKLIDNENTYKHNVHARAAKFPFSNARYFDFSNYHSYSEIMTFLNTTAQNAPFAIKTTVESIGKSYEGRDIYVIRIEERDPSIQIKPHIFIDGGIHAREWVSPASTLYFIDQLVNNANSRSVSSLLHTFVWHIVPVLNPDGYEYSRTNERLWRKNRRPTSNGGRKCYGVDLNRNFDFQWNPDIGGSTNPCSDIFAGAPLSELESSNLSKYLGRYGNVQTEKSNIIAYLTIHSYGQMWLYPWGYTSALPKDWTDLNSAATEAVNALSAVHKTQYLIGSSTNILYSAAGGSDDCAKGKHHIKYSYTLELRDANGYYGFQLPANQIVPTSEETWAGIVAFANYLIGQHCANSNGECIWQ